MSNVSPLSTNKTRLSENEIKAFLTDNLQEMRRYAYSLTKDTHDADDLLQTVFERILKTSIPADAQPKAWVYRVCRNIWIDELRARQVRHTPDSCTETELEDTSVASRPSSQIYQIELHNAIEELAEPYGIIINLVIVAGLSYSEAAEVLEIPIGTVMSRLARARQQLVERLNANNQHEHI